MPRNLDLTALRAFVTVADAGGVTRASAVLHRTQSAVSMQLKRLERALDAELFDRSARQLTLTPGGEQLLGYARKILSLNDEVYSRFTDQSYEGEITLGVPHDVVYPAIPHVLRRFKVDFPRMHVRLLASFTESLKPAFEHGKCDLILTTEDGCGPGGETLATLPLVWVGAIGGTAWKRRPLPLAFERRCLFRRAAQEALDNAGIPWELTIDSEQTRAVEATVSADLAVEAMLEGTEPPRAEVIDHKGALPELGRINVNLYRSVGGGPVLQRLADLVRRSFHGETITPVA